MANSTASSSKFADGITKQSIEILMQDGMEVGSDGFDAICFCHQDQKK